MKGGEGAEEWAEWHWKLAPLIDGGHREVFTIVEWSTGTLPPGSSGDLRFTSPLTAAWWQEQGEKSDDEARDRHT